MPHVRKTHVRILELVEEGVLNAQSMLETALAYMSEDDIKKMIDANDINLCDDEQDDEQDDECGEEPTDGEVAETLGVGLQNAWGQDDVEEPDELKW